MKMIEKFHLTPMTYTKKIRYRIRFLWLTIIAMLIYMVWVGQNGGGDSRIMSNLADQISRLIFFGGMIFIFYRIYYNKKLLKNKLLLEEQKLREYDERQQFLHSQSGGTVVDLLLLFLLFITVHTSLFNMDAFHISLIILLITLGLKILFYMVYARKH